MKNLLITISMLFFLLTGCEEKTTRPPIMNGTPNVSDIREDIVVTASKPVSGVVAQDTYTVDLGNDPLVLSDEYDDLLVRYGTSTLCDENVWMYNYETQSFLQIGFRPPRGTRCPMALGTRGWLFSAVGEEIDGYVSDSYQMKFVSDRIRWLRVQAIMKNPSYFAIPAFVETPFGKQYFEGITYLAPFIYLSTSSPAKLYVMSMEGTIVKDIKIDVAKPEWLTSDGHNLWILYRLLSVFKLSADGELLDRFSIPIKNPRCITWARNELWIESRYSGTSRFYSIDPRASCQSGIAVVTDSIENPEKGVWGLTWDGTHLIAIGEYINFINLDGEVFGSSDVSVYGIRDIAWDGRTLWMVSAGPKDFGGNRVINRFKIFYGTK